MKKIALTLLTIFSLFVISCEIGLGASVDTDAPSLDIQNPPVDSIIRDTFAISGTWADDGNIADVTVTLRRTDINNSDSKNIKGTLAGDIRLGGSGTWSAEIVPKAEDGTTLISDGSYQATVTIKDTVGRTTIRNTTFTIDNTPPVIVLTRPSTAADSLSSDTYGQTFNLEGQAADTNNVSLIEVMIYSDAACTNHIHTVPLKNVPNSINMDVAKFVKGDTENDYFKIYGESTTDGGPKQFYCKLVAYDGAQRYPADGSAQTEADQKGNAIDSYYLYKDIATTILQNYKITEVYSMLNGTYTPSGAARSVTVDDVMTLLNSSKKTQGKFTLNPKNNPTFAVTGRNPLLLNGSDFTGTANNISDGTKVVIEVSPGLDGILLEESSLKVFAVECDLNGKKTGTPIELDFDKEESGTSYRLITKIEKSKGLAIGKSYLFEVEGWDQSEAKNPVEPAGLAYGFRMASSGKAPVLELTTPPSSTSYTNESKQVFVGSVSVEDGVPKVIATYNNTEYEITNFTTSANGNETKYSFEWESPDFGDSNSTHQFEFKAVMDTDSQPIERTIVHDIDKPVIGDLKINEAKKYYRDASHANYENGQTYPERYLNATINASIDITDPYDAIKTATYKIILNDNEAAATEVAMVNPSKFVFPPLDTTQITDGTKVTFKVVASDRAGNTETHSEEFIVDQETNIPFVYPKDHDNISLRADAEDQKINVTASSSFALKVYDDDGVGSSKLAVTAKRSGRLTSRNATTTDDNWTTLESPAITFIDDELTIRVPDSGGYYKYKISVRDIANNITYDVPEFVIHAAIAAASVTSVTKNPAYIQNVAGKSFTITVDGLSSQGPYKLFRRIGENPNTGKEPDATDLVLNDGFVEVKNNISDFPISDTITIQENNPIAEGTKVYYYVEDSTPRESLRDKFVEITFDDDVPTLSITSPSTNKTGTSALSEPIMFGGSSSDAKSGIAKVYYRFTQDPDSDESAVPYVEIDSSTQPLKSSPFTIDNVQFIEGTDPEAGKLQEGKWYFQAYAEDAAGNISTKDVKEFDINLKAPTLTVTVDGNTPDCKLSGGAYYFKGNFTGSVTSSDTSGSGKVEFFVGNSNTAAITWNTINHTSEAFSISADEFTESVQQKLTIKATDTFGKSTPETINVYKDTTNPELSVSNPGDQTTAAVTIRGTANDAGVGVEKVQWSISGEPGTYDDVTTFNHNSPNWSLSVADLGSEGEKTYYFKAVDALNNTTAEESVSFMYDKAAPSITTKSGSETLTSSTTKPVTTTNDKFKFTIVETNGLAASNAVSITVKKGETSLELTNGYTIKDGETSITELSSLQPNKEYTIEINSYTDALYSYEISAIDNAGKTSGLVTRSIRLDTTAPVIVVTSPDFEDYQNSNSINVKGTCEDDSGTLAVWYATGATAPAIPTGDLTLESTWTTTPNTWKQAEGTSSWTAKNIPGVEETPTKIYFVAVDKNGIATKASDIVTKEYKVDLYNPSFEETSIGEGKAYKNASYTFSGKASDTGSGIKSIVISAGSNTYAWYKNPSDGTTTSGFTYNSSTNNWSYTVSVASAAEQEYNYTLTATDGADKTTILSRTVVYDKTKPVIATIPAGSWYKTKTITITPTVTDYKTGSTTVIGSGVDTVEASLIAYDSAHPDADRGWIDIPLSNGAYKGTVDFAEDGKDKKIYIRAKDRAGNISSPETEVSVNIDTTDPDLEKLKYKVGNTSLKDIGGTVYINATNGITIYGSYSDDLSGVGELTFTGDGYKTNVSDGNNGYKKPVVTYSTVTPIPTGKTVEDSVMNYESYSADNADNITYWKAVFTNDILASGKLSVTGTNSAGGSKTINLFTVDKDTVPPTFKNEKIEPDTEEFSVYKTKEGSGASEKTVYYLNHKKQNFNISGLASDANTAVDQVYIKIYKIGATGNPETNPSITDNNATGYFSNIQFADLKNDGTVDSFWQNGAKVVITTTDIAGNSTADNDSETVLNIKFDSESPTSKHDEIDATGKDLVFRIGDSTNDDITETNAAQYGLTWNQYTDTTTSKTYTKIDETAGGKYSGGSFGNSYTQKVRGHFTDSGSGLKQVFYKIYDRTESKIFDSSTKEEKYDLTDAEKQALIEDVVSANQYFAPLSTPEYKRVFYNVEVGSQDTLGGNQLKKNSEPVIERKIKNADGSWLTIKDTTDPAYASATEFYKYWKLEEANYSFTIPQLNEGSNYLVIVAEDNVGNFYVDTSDPIDHDGDSSTPARKYSNFSMNVDTTPPVIELKDSTGTEYTTEVRYSDGGDYNIEVKVTDFGVVDTTEPTGYVPNTSSGIKKVELTTSEGTVKCSPRSGTTNIYTGNVKTILKNNKTLTVSATAYDVAGSSSTKVVANVMVDETAPTVTLTAPTDADKTATGTQINGKITISGTASDPNGSGLNEAVALYYKVVSETAAAPAKPADNADTTANTWDWTRVTGVTPSGTSPWSFENVDTTAITDGSRVFFTASVKDNARNVGYANPVEVFIDQDSDRPVIKITSMSLSGMASDNRAGSKEPELTGSVSDDDEVPNALAYRIGDTGDFTDSEATGSSLSYSASDGQFTLTLDDGPQNVYFKVTTNEKDDNNEYVTFETKLNPANAAAIQTMPKLTDRGGTKYGYKDSTTTTKATVIYLAVDTEAPETEEFAFTRDPSDEASWTSAISGEYFGGNQKQTFYLREYAYDANEVKQVYLSLPADEKDGESTAITAWTYKNEQTRVTKTIYTKGNQPAAAANYWIISTASDTEAGTLSDASADHKTVTITGGDNAGTYTRSAYIFQLSGPGTEKTGKAKYYLWQSANNNPVDVTNLASGERNATLVTFDGTRQTTETKIIRIDNTEPTINISAPTSVTSTAVVNGSIVGESEKTTVSFAVTKTDVTDGSTITSWTEEEKAGTSSFKVNFDGGDENDAYETHTSLLKQYLITLGILTQNDIDTKSAKARQLQPVHVWIKSEDNCNNIAYNKALVYVDALGNIPTVTIGYPTSDGQTLGGSVSIMGTAKDNVDPKYVWIQFDITGTNRDSPSYVPAWTMDDYNIIKSDYQFGNMKTNEDVAAADVTTSNIADIGIKVPVEGGSWSQIINTLRLFPNSTATANDITMWVYATDDDNGDGTVINVSRAETRTFSVDKDNPYFVQDTLKLVQYEIAADPTSTKKRELVYKEGMYIRGIWWLEGEVRDESSGINEVKKNDYGDNNQYGEYSDNLVSQTTEDIYFTPKLDGTKTNYTFKIKVGDESESGRNRFKIKAWENKSPDTRDDEKEFIIYYDNKDPTFNAPANSSDGIAKEVKNSDGFYGLHSTAYEANTNDSGVERVAVYFTRTIASGANAGTYIFDPMYKRGYEIDEKDVSKIKIDDSLVQDTTGDKLYWGSATASTLAGVRVTLTTEVKSYVHVGGLAKIDGFVYRILEISSDKKTVTLSSAPHNLTTDKKVYFAVANVVDNTKEEKKPTNATSGLSSEYCYGYPDFAENVDDGDGIMEYLKNIDSTTWNWNLYVNSKNIPDGAITIHYVIFDKAGNSAYGSVEDASVENNQPRLVSVKIGRDVNQDGSIATTNPETITYYKNGSTEVEDKPSLYKNGLTSIDIPKIVVKSTMEVTPEIVGGNGKIYYKIKKGAETTYTGYGTSGAGIELMDGNDDYDNAAWTDASDHVKEGSLDTKTATITHNLDSNNPVRYQQLISANNATWSLSYELYDSKEAGEVNKVYINIPEIDFAVYDEEAPSVAITPFYWKQDGDIKKSSAIYEDVEIDGVTKTIARGHIDLKGELPDTFNGTSGVNDGDDKVSGIIKIEGTATDTRKLSALYIQVPGMEAWFGEDKANLPQEDFGSENSSDIYYQISTYNGTSWTDKAANLSTYGFAFQTSGNSLTDTGHTVNWTFTWDTSRISTITAADVNIKVLAEDAASEASASDDNPQNKTTAEPLKVDVVPYITRLVTDISESAGEEFARSATGKYIVKGSYLDTDKTTVKTETVKVYGFNLALSANSKNSAASIGSGTGTLSAGDTDATGSYLNMAIGATTTSGKLAITVNDISSLNNVNQNPEFEAGAVSAKTDSKAMYNSQANDETNNRLTDDVELVVWDMNYFLNEVDITSPMLKMDKTGNYYMSYGYGVPNMFVNKNGITRRIDFSYNKFHNTNVAFDDNGNIYAVATNTDRVVNDSSRFVLYTPSSDYMPDQVGNTADDKYDYGYRSTTKRHLEMAYNSDTGVYNINRVKRPKLTSYTNGTDTYLAVAYYDYNNNSSPVKFRFGKKSGGSTTYTQGGTEYTFAWRAQNSGFRANNSGNTNINGNNLYVKIGEEYYPLTKEDVGNYYNNYVYTFSGYNSEEGFKSYTYTKTSTDATLSGGIMNNVSANGHRTDDPTYDCSAPDYHTIADKNTSKQGGEYAAVGIVPKKNGNTVTGYVGVVAWYDANASKVCYSYNEDPDTAVAGGDWQSHAKYIDSAKYSGWYVDLDVDEDGGIHIAYYNSAKGDLRYVYLPNYNYTDNNTVTPVTVDSYLSAGTNITVNVRKQGDNCVPYIYYYNASGNQTSNSIKVAWRKDMETLRDGAIGDKFTGAWECMTVPSANIPVEATVCGGVPSTATGNGNTYKNTTVFLGYMTDKYYEKAYIKGDITSANW